MHCKNCQTDLNVSQNFCFECGAKVIKNRLTLKIIANQVTQEFFSIDNKFLQTFFSLFSKPEDVINGYINGVRKKYIGAIPYYAISLTILGIQMFLLKHFFSEFLEGQDQLFSEGYKVGSGNSENPFGQLSDIFSDYQGVFFSILMPFIAIGTWLVFLNKGKYNYTEHLVINLYLTAQTIYFSFVFFMLFAILNIQDYLITSIIITPLLIIYGSYVFKRIFEISFISATLRYVLAYLIYMVVFFIIIIIVSIIAVVFLIATGKLNL